MRIALVGIGEVGRYFVEVFSQSSHSVVVLTSKRKEFLDDIKVEQRITDYSLDSLTSILSEFDAIVSTSSGPQDAYITLHTNILEACKASKTCKRFLPSEWTVNIDEFIDQPIYHVPGRPNWRQKLREQNDVKYSLVCIGWFADYVLPSSQRYLRDVGKGYPANHDTKTFQLYTHGRQKVSLTSVRDVARGALALVDEDPNEWKEYTHFAAQTITYYDIFETLRKYDASWKSEEIYFADILAALDKGEDTEERYLQLMAFLGANELPEQKRISFGEGFLKGYKGRTIEDLLQEASKDRNQIL